MKIGKYYKTYQLNLNWPFQKNTVKKIYNINGLDAKKRLKKVMCKDSFS